MRDGVPLNAPGAGTSADATVAVMELISAVEALAATCITERIESAWFGASVSTRTTTYCRQCVRASRYGQRIDHAASCIVGRALDAAAAVRKLQPPVPSFSEKEVAALRRMDGAITEAISDAVNANPAPVGILRQVSSEVRQDFIADRPVRHIEYDALPAAAAESATAPVEVLVYEPGRDYARVATHEEAAAFLGGVFSAEAK